MLLMQLHLTFSQKTCTAHDEMMSALYYTLDYTNSLDEFYCASSLKQVCKTMIYHNQDQHANDYICS